MGVAIVAYNDSSSGLRFGGLRYYCCSYSYLAELCAQHSSKQYLNHRLLGDAGNLCCAPLCGINGRLNPDFSQFSCFPYIYKYINIGIKELLKKIKKIFKKICRFKKSRYLCIRNWEIKVLKLVKNTLKKVEKHEKTNFFRKNCKKVLSKFGS